MLKVCNYACEKEGAIIKKVKILLPILVICLLLSGCSSLRISSIDDLITPVSPGGDDAGILAAVDEYCKSGYSVKVPLSGHYTTSFIRYDLSGDGNDEAVAFYEPADKLSTVEMALLKKIGSGWKVVKSITGEGTDVSSVEFCDLNNDGNVEIIVCWSVISRSTASNLCVYKQKENGDDYSIQLLDNSVSSSDFVCADVNGDGVNEVLAFTTGSASSSPKAELYSFSSGKKRLIGETKLDSAIISFDSIVCGETDEGVSIYADAVRSSGGSMVTELLYWSNYYDSVISPFYSYTTGRTKDTTRSNMINSRDIDGDGEIEIPLDRSLSSLPEEITAQNWVSYRNTVLNHNTYSIACEKDCYLLVLKDDLLSKLTFTYTADARELTAKSGKEEVFKILTVLKSGYDSSKFADYTEIYSDSGFAYLVKVNPQSAVKVSTDDIKNSIRTY